LEGGNQFGIRLTATLNSKFSLLNRTMKPRHLDSIFYFFLPQRFSLNSPSISRSNHKILFSELNHHPILFFSLLTTTAEHESRGRGAVAVTPKMAVPIGVHLCCA
jgi:hypothetical protein